MYDAKLAKLLALSDRLDAARDELRSATAECSSAGVVMVHVGDSITHAQRSVIEALDALHAHVGAAALEAHRNAPRKAS